MTQVNDLVEYARAQGVAFFEGKLATSNSLNSARLQAIIPAIKAIEGQEIEFTPELGGLITRAYIDGTKAPISDNSMSSAISKTNLFLRVADMGHAGATIALVETIIRETNEKAARDSMSKGMFEKLNKLMSVAAKNKATPQRDEVTAVLNPQAVDPSKDEKLVDLFKKLAKLAKDAAALDMNKYSALAVEGLRYEQWAKEHAARAARAGELDKADKANASMQPAPVTPQSNEVKNEEHDEVDMLLNAA